jgi:lysine 2-monooxygenase
MWQPALIASAHIRRGNAPLMSPNHVVVRREGTVSRSVGERVRSALSKVARRLGRGLALGVGLGGIVRVPFVRQIRVIRRRAGQDGDFDVAIVGAGAAGTYLAYRLIKARPDWRIALFERSNRIGGRLWSVKVDVLEKPIELGGMRYMTGHVLVHSIVEELGIETREFDPGEHAERMFLRGVVGRSADDPESGRGYDLPPGEHGRSASDLLRDAFLRIVPQARELDEAGWRRHRATATFGGRPLTDWSTEEAVATTLSPECHRYMTDAFGYDSGINPHNTADAIQYVMGTGYPSGKARVPVDGMDRITRELAARFEALGGTVRLGHDLERVEAGEGSIILGFADGSDVRARRLVLTLPIPALQALATASPVINGPAWQRLYGSIAGYPGIKLYCWYDRPWWRDGADAPTGLRTTTDLPPRKIFYFDEGPDRPSGMLAAFTDYRHNEPILALADDRSEGAPAPAALLDALHGWLAVAHPGAEVPAVPTGSAFQHWGADPREVAWHFWRAGHNSDDMMDLAVQPDRSLPIHLCGEVFSRRGAWVEGALETASAVAEHVLGVPAQA